MNYGESPLTTVKKHMADVESCCGVRSDAGSGLQTVGPMKPCPLCRLLTPYGGVCGRCRRLLHIGILVEWVTTSHSYLLTEGRGYNVLKALDAVAALLTDHAITAANHRKEIREWERDVQDTGRDGYSNGVQDEQERNDRW